MEMLFQNGVLPGRAVLKQKSGISVDIISEVAELVEMHFSIIRVFH